jgi:hypothetical protein
MKHFKKKKYLKRYAKEGDSPVFKSQNVSISILSTAGSETPCGNPAAPSAKAKYS